MTNKHPLDLSTSPSFMVRKSPEPGVPATVLSGKPAAKREMTGFPAESLENDRSVHLRLKVDAERVPP
jgi:hypothetical protein